MLNSCPQQQTSTSLFPREQQPSKRFSLYSPKKKKKIIIINCSQLTRMSSRPSTRLQNPPDFFVYRNISWGGCSQTEGSVVWIVLLCQQPTVWQDGLVCVHSDASWELLSCLRLDHAHRCTRWYTSGGPWMLITVATLSFAAMYLNASHVNSSAECEESSISPSIKTADIEWSVWIFCPFQIKGWGSLQWNIDFFHISSFSLSVKVPKPLLKPQETKTKEPTDWTLQRPEPR